MTARSPMPDRANTNCNLIKPRVILTPKGDKLCAAAPTTPWREGFCPPHGPEGVANPPRDTHMPRGERGCQRES